MGEEGRGGERKEEGERDTNHSYAFTSVFVLVVSFTRGTQNAVHVVVSATMSRKRKHVKYIGKLHRCSTVIRIKAFLLLLHLFILTPSIHLLDQGGANYGPGGVCGPLRFLIGPAKLEEMHNTALVHLWKVGASLYGEEVKIFNVGAKTSLERAEEDSFLIGVSCVFALCWKRRNWERKVNHSIRIHFRFKN